MDRRERVHRGAPAGALFFYGVGLGGEGGKRVKSAFADYHPAVSFLYFVLVLGFTMFCLHPACLALSLAGAFCWSVRLKGRQAVWRNLAYMLPVLAVAALVNPAFNHEGATILTYLPSGNPLTLESILYGLAAAAMLVAVLCWFSCYHQVMTSDKFVYLFGRIIPALSLVLTMVLRFVPRFQEQFRTVSSAQKCVGRDLSNGGLTDKVRHGARILSILVTWALESAIDTADSMRSRGYGLPGRTAFSLYRLEERDTAALTWLLGLGFYLAMMTLAGGTRVSYFPKMKLAAPDAWSLSAFLAWGGLCFTPMAADWLEERRRKEGAKA